MLSFEILGGVGAVAVLLDPGHDRCSGGLCMGEVGVEVVDDAQGMCVLGAPSGRCPSRPKRRIATLPWWSSIQEDSSPSAGIPDHELSWNTRASHRAAPAGSS